MMTIPTLHRPFIRQLFFWIGILSTVLYRLIVVFKGANPLWLNIAWYLGTIGFIVYFAHRFQISRRRARVIAAAGLPAKIAADPNVSPEDKAALAYVFQTLESSKEKWNYVVIFVSSAAALLYGVWIDFLR